MQFLRVSGRKKQRFCSAGPFFLVLYMIVYHTALISRKLVFPKKFLVTRPENYSKQGLCATLRWYLNAVPIFSSNTKAILPSLESTPKTFRKMYPVRGSIVPDENEIFRKPYEIKCFANLTENLCPVSYKF